MSLACCVQFRGARQAAAVAGLLLGLVCTAHGAPRPKLVCDAPVFEFGLRANTATIEHAFRIRNAGKAVLLLGKVRTTCGCTVAKLTTDQVKPGNEAVLHAALTLVGRVGEQRKTIYVDSNDPDVPLLRLEFHGTAFAEIELQPREGAYFGKLSRTQPAEKEVRIAANANTTFQVKQVVVDSPDLEYELNAVRPGKEYSLRLRVRTPRAVGETATVARVVTDHPRYAEVPVPVRWVTEQDVFAVPRQITLRDSDLATPDLVRHVLVRSPAGTDFRITGLTKPAESLEVKIVKLRNGCFRLEVRGFPPDYSLNDRVIRVTTDVTDCPDIDIPIRIHGPPSTGAATAPGTGTERTATPDSPGEVAPDSPGEKHTGEPRPRPAD